VQFLNWMIIFVRFVLQLLTDQVTPNPPSLDEVGLTSNSSIAMFTCILYSMSSRLTTTKEIEMSDLSGRSRS